MRCHKVTAANGKAGMARFIPSLLVMGWCVTAGGLQSVSFLYVTDRLVKAGYAGYDTQVEAVHLRAGTALIASVN